MDAWASGRREIGGKDHTLFWNPGDFLACSIVVDRHLVEHCVDVRFRLDVKEAKSCTRKEAIKVDSSLVQKWVTSHFE